ncbi:hypothetical protein DFP74_4844 [Nocardiopsis sp. Huas11]|uniref:hypothetical protein n=1 Tax=Nocardiopsis sp. Huas11 TaxID=2183912 RepID=UPI000F0D9CDA|nr:hypothetical protein [Nocardiopsis sp. Huas11]RKS09115.1 hypothetical protein DFP74_4844 [Nocardiopsis sp. Huas11]
MRWWKVLGVAAFAGVAASGVAIARAERKRRAYTPDQVRDRLRERVAQASAAAEGTEPPGPVPVPEAERGGPLARARAVLTRARDRVGTVRGTLLTRGRS